WEVRERAVEGMEEIGIAIDKNKNKEVRAEFADLSAAHSKTKILLVPTNEELMIAMETDKIINQG
ncbi:MAG: acetate kinase, partial [Bacteroidetes bacterium]